MRGRWFDVDRPGRRSLLRLLRPKTIRGRRWLCLYWAVFACIAAAFLAWEVTRGHWPQVGILAVWVFASLANVWFQTSLIASRAAIEVLDAQQEQREAADEMPMYSNN